MISLASDPKTSPSVCVGRLVIRMGTPGDRSATLMTRKTREPRISLMTRMKRRGRFQAGGSFRDWGGFKAICQSSSAFLSVESM